MTIFRVKSVFPALPGPQDAKPDSAGIRTPFKPDESGQTLVIILLCMLIMFGFVGFATDVGLMLRERRMAQAAADSAALAAATEALNEGTPTSVTTGMWNAASHDAILAGFTPGSSNGTMNSSTGVTLTLYQSPNVTISNFNSAGYIQAIIQLNTNTFFMGLSGISNINVGATAIGADDISSNGCIYVQNDGDYANDVSPNGAAVDMGGHSLVAASSCGMTVNGDVNMGGSSSINALFLAATGTIVGSGTPPNTTSGAPQQPDPESKLQNDLASVKGTICTAPSGSGMSCVYDYGCSGSCKANNCSGGVCTISGATLNSNTVYYFDQPVNVSGAVSGSQVTLYLAGNTNYFDFDANGTVTLTPPGYGTTAGCKGSSNPLCGVVLDAPTAGSNGQGTYSCSSGKGNNGGNPGEIYLDFGSSSTTWDGIIYAPYMQLFGQDKGSSSTFNADLVVGNICMQSSTFDVNGFSGNNSPLTRAGLVY